MKRTAFVLVVTLLLNATQGTAQIADPVTWKFSAEKINESEYALLLTASIDQGWHLYSQDIPPAGPIPTTFTFHPSDSYERIGEVVETIDPEVKYDESFKMDLKMFSVQAVFRQVIRSLVPGSFEVNGTVEFMSCDDERCLPPREEAFSIMIPPGDDSAEEEATGEEPVSSSGDAPGMMTSTVELSAGDTEAGSRGNFQGKSLWGLFFVAFLLGFAGVLTPCVYPMIPMTVTFFMRGSENRRRALFQALVFGFSIVAIYTLIGLVISLTSAGANFANVLSTHWIPNLIFFLLFLIFAASFLGMFEIIIPGSLTSKVDRQADRGGFLGAFFMALTLTLVSFSCTGPIVGYLLVQAATGEVLEPLVGMLGFSVAFALPFTLLAFSPSLLKSLPKSGGWLNSVKVVMGFLILAFGFKFLSNIDQAYHLGILSRDLYLAIWIVLFTILGFYLLGKIRFAHDSDVPFIGVPRLFLAVASFSFALYMVPGLFGAPLSGISGILPPQKAQQFDLTEYTGDTGKQVAGGSMLCDVPRYSDLFSLPHGLQGYFDYEQGMACARELNKPVLLDFKGHACSNCKEMEAKVWSDPGVLQRLKDDYVIIALYTDDKTKLPEDEWITSEYDGKVKDRIGKKNADLQITRFGANTQPFYAPVDHNGELLTTPIGYNLDAEAFRNFLDRGVAEFERRSH
ncbi:MAG TPA: disulfide bond formation protein DsbD [Bacteroidetes bacterium]|nr:disulfide bond formation protein DsbD [Bacteroidota bacterium]